MAGTIVSPSYSASLYDANGAELAIAGPGDPNVTAGTTGRFILPLANSGIAIGCERSNLSGRNFDGHIAAVRLYNRYRDRALARSLSGELANLYTRTAAPE